MIIILDTETTGFNEPEVVEMAYLEVNYPELRVQNAFDEYYMPSKPIELGALATHHILMSELEGSKHSNTCKLPNNVEYVIGHNVDFDLKVLGADENLKRIDTLALSRYLVPDLDSYSQGAMMYYFMGDSAKERLKEAHNALADVCNCRELLIQLLQVINEDNGLFPETIEHLYQLSELARIPKVLHFGKFKGQDYKSLDQGYVTWWLTKSDTPPDLYQRKALTLAGFKL